MQNAVADGAGGCCRYSPSAVHRVKIIAEKKLKLWRKAVSQPYVDFRHLYFPERRNTMSGTKDKVKGAVNEAKGSVKDAAGKLTGNDKLRAEGAADKAKGKVQHAVGEAKDKLDKH
jgi:uncharacterized protein YjbJ (UPF0337 family)